MNSKCGNAWEADCATRAKLWQEYVGSYQMVLDETPQSFSAFYAEFLERFLRAKQNSWLQGV